jgi:hypothetical protein
LASALAATRDARTARVAHSVRDAEAFGELEPNTVREVGVVDFVRGQVQLGRPEDPEPSKVFAGALCYYGPMEDGLWRDLSLGAAADAPIRSSNPLWLLEVLDHVRPGARELGRAALDAVPVWRFAAETEQRAATGMVEGLVQIVRSLASVEGQPLPPVPTEIWVDGDGLVRLIAARRASLAPGPGGGPPGWKWETSELTDHGSAIEPIVVPTASQFAK